MDYSRKKQRGDVYVCVCVCVCGWVGGDGGGGVRTFFLKTFQEFLCFSLYPWKFQTKQASRLETPQNCVTPLGNFKA